MNNNQLKNYIDSIPDFPKKGILFRDILPILRHPKIFNSVIEYMAKIKECSEADALIAIDARGFLFGSPLALKIDKPLILARKPNKLPGKIISQEYQLEYGSNSLSLQEKSIEKYNKYAIIDDLLATGGTVDCLQQLLKNKGKTINCLAVVIELENLKGRKKFNFPTISQVVY